MTAWPTRRLRHAPPAADGNRRALWFMALWFGVPLVLLILYQILS